MKKFLAIPLLLISALPATAQSADPPPATSGQSNSHRAWSDACKTKITQICPQAKPGFENSAHACLRAHNTNFYQVCPDEALALKAKREARGENAPMTPWPAPASAP